jgi:hypothetical protein
MTALGLLEPLFLSPAELLDDTMIDEIQRVGEVVIDEHGRALLREIVRDYIWQRRWMPPSQSAMRDLKKIQKSQLKGQKLRQDKIASAFEEAAALLEEELGQGGLSPTSLEAKAIFEHIALPLSLRETARHMRTIAQIARVQRQETVETIPGPKIRRGRPSDRLNFLILQFAIVHSLAGAKLSGGSDPMTGRGRITPVVRAAKLLIDALPEDCPRLSLLAIADRINDQRLIATAKEGVKILKGERRASKSG